MKTIEWGFLIVNYLFLGGLSAGLFFVSALATFLYKIEEPSPYTRIARLGAFLAPRPKVEIMIAQNKSLSSDLRGCIRVSLRLIVRVPA